MLLTELAGHGNGESLGMEELPLRIVRRRKKLKEDLVILPIPELTLRKKKK